MSTSEIEHFAWTCDEQKEGYLALLSYFNQFGKSYGYPIEHLEICFLILKMHEASEYWRETVSDQVAQALHSQAAAMQDKFDDLHRRIDLLEEVVRNQTIALESMRDLLRK